MQIMKHPDTTRELGKPENWNDEQNGECVTLPIVDVVFDGLPCMLSFWKPTPKELEMLNSNGCIELHIYGRDVHPVVAVCVNGVRE